MFNIKQFIQAILSAALLVVSYIPVISQWMGPMVLPIAVYIIALCFKYPEFRPLQFNLLLYNPRLLAGRIISFIGLIIFLTAFIQLVISRRKPVSQGLYNIVRHPQYLGLNLFSLGLAVMSIQYTGFNTSMLTIWLLQALGYITLALYEERSLVKQYGLAYRMYRENVPFMIPLLKVRSRLEPLITIIILYIIGFIITLLF